MVFSGIEKSSLVDFDGYLACTVFTKGCNFQCPFCQNSNLVNGVADTLIDENDILTFLKKRQGLLDAVCVTGGEPSLHDDVKNFFEKVKALGYKTKLDTNGSNPDFIKDLVNAGLVDYVAMDYKNCLCDYPAITGGYSDTDNIKKSVQFLLLDKVDYEFRTTLVKGFHSENSIKEIAHELKGAKKYFLQKFEDRGTVLVSGLSAINEETALEFKKILQNTIKNVSLRGYM